MRTGIIETFHGFTIASTAGLRGRCRAGMDKKVVVALPVKMGRLPVETLTAHLDG